MTTAQGQQLADEYHIPFFETSAKTDQNVESAFTRLVETVCNRLFNADAQPKNPSDAAVGLKDAREKPKPSGGCC